MIDPRPLTLVGAYGSPYSRKMRALLRCRRIPFRWVMRGSPEAAGLPRPRVDLIPVLLFPDDPETAHIDSTPLIRRLEEMYPQRSVVPPDPGVAFLDALVEDYADEWLTKAMFHFRWSYPGAAAKAAQVLAFDIGLGLGRTDHRELSRAFSARQTGRLELVGCNDTTAPVIEASFRRLLEVLDPIIESRTFVFGNRPATGDFGLFGQLSQLVLFDQPSTEVAVTVAPRVVAWTQSMEDLDSTELEEAGWLPRPQVAAAVRALLGEIGRVYAPFLLANDRALAEGRELVQCTVDGRPWVQRAFRYQGKCLEWLRAARAGLAPGDRAWVDETLAGTGCDALFP